ncbi:MAG: alpha/beta fold hydrolase [bacterium]|nr:alpha/beta fold hydrolase [Gammaproteobacteria bacterium]
MENDNSAKVFDDVMTLNPVIGLSMSDVLAAGRTILRQGLLQPAIFAEQSTKLWRDWIEIGLNQSDLVPAPRDRRFSDKSFEENRGYSNLVKGWLAWQNRMLEWVEALDLEETDRGRARFLVQLYIDTMAPTNFLLGNPSALRKAYQSGGQSLFTGLKNFIGDLQDNGGMPSQVDKSAFTVGGNVATTEGVVVFTTPILELIQYKPVHQKVKARPVFIVPPQINKFYLYDLSEHNSFVRYLLKEGFQVFIVSWRNPTPEHRDWGLEDYIDSIDQAIDACLEVTGQDAINGVGACAGGITFSAALGYFAGVDTLSRVNSLNLMVNVLETHGDDSVLGLFATEDAIEGARKRSAAKGILDGEETARVFNWMRPNDLIWNYHVSNYLHGDKPPVFDILFWNNDTTRLPARLHSDFLNIFRDNPLCKQGMLEIKGVPIDMKKVDCDVLITGGTTDHITPWQACYRSTKLFGGDITYLLSTAGHIQSLLNPPTSSKRTYFLNSDLPDTPREWLEDAEEHPGSWWPYWSGWLTSRSKGEVDAPVEQGSEKHPAGLAAPGSYVHE